MELKYYFHVQLSGQNRSANVDVKFNPASISKLFYAIFFITKRKSLLTGKVRLRKSDIRKYGYGTRRLGWWDLGRNISYRQLLEMSIINSCNISTGILADKLGRENVNTFVKEEIGLLNTTIHSAETINSTTVTDLVKTANYIWKFEHDLQDLMELLLINKRRAVIKSLLPECLVFSKGGTTFAGLRRDMALVKGKTKDIVIVVQEGEMTKFSIRDRLLSKLSKGKYSQHLQELDRQFQIKVQELLDAGTP